MCIIVVFLIMKTFYFLRIVPSLTPIVVMITNVVYDLRIFLFFYGVLVILCALTLAILGLGNKTHPGVVFDDPEHEEDPIGRMLKGKKGGGGGGVIEISLESFDDAIKEYKAVGLMMGEIIWTLRFSLGDFSGIAASAFLTYGENIIFWILFILIVGITNIVFLNFIVAEASASYAKVVDTLESVVWMEKASLIGESESMTMK